MNSQSRENGDIIYFDSKIHTSINIRYVSSTYHSNTYQYV